MALPRYFLPRAGAPTELRPLGRVAFPLDVFAIEPAAAPAEEWVLGMGDAGVLTVQRREPEAELLPPVREAVAFNEVSNRDVRALAQESLHALEVLGVEGTPDAPGMDEAVYVYGALVGPLVPGCRDARRIEGKLAVTRADLLQALVAGAEQAFLHRDPVADRTARTLHMLLPGDRPEVLASGQGAVIAYPVSGRDTEEVGPGNEVLVTEILQEILGAVRDKRPTVRTVDDLLRSARELLSRLPDWPGPRSRALFARVRPGVRRPPTSTGPLTVAPTATPPPASRVEEDWLGRFIDKYDEPRTEGSPPAKLTEDSPLAKLVEEAGALYPAPSGEADPRTPALHPIARVAVEGSIVTAELSREFFRASADVSVYVQASIQAWIGGGERVEAAVRGLVQDLAPKARSGCVRTVYWSSGPRGAGVELVGELGRETASRFRWRSPGEGNASAQILPAMWDYVRVLKDRTWELRGGEIQRPGLRGGCAIFLVQGDVGDVSEAAAYSDALGEAVARGELSRLGFVVVSLVDDVTNRLARIISRIRGREPWPLWAHCTADEAQLAPDLVASVIDRVTGDAQNAKIMDDHGNVLRTYSGRLPPLLTFEIPAHARAFALVLGDRRYVQALP